MGWCRIVVEWAARYPRVVGRRCTTGDWAAAWAEGAWTGGGR